jgi:hypothetical protein
MRASAVMGAAAPHLADAHEARALLHGDAAHPLSPRPCIIITPSLAQPQHFLSFKLHPTQSQHINPTHPMKSSAVEVSEKWSSVRPWVHVIVSKWGGTL